MIVGRPLHHVLKIGDRAKNIFFFREVLGMTVLRHEEFTETCEAKCNGPYDNTWSKTMMGYGDESEYFTMELIYNYGVSSYELGNEFQGVTIKSRNACERIESNNYPHTVANGSYQLKSPDGYNFSVLNEPEPTDSDPIVRLSYSSNNLVDSINYWQGLLNMTLKEQNDVHAVLSYGPKSLELELVAIEEPINRAQAYGRVVFAVPYAIQPSIDELIKKNEKTILTPLCELDTPGKATVRVIILADPDGHEICFVDDEGFSQLSEFDSASDGELNEFIAKDPFQSK